MAAHRTVAKSEISITEPSSDLQPSCQRNGEYVREITVAQTLPFRLANAARSNAECAYSRATEEPLAEQTSRGQLQVSAVERLLLVNQFAILERLYPAMKHELAAKRLILERRDSQHYDVLFAAPAGSGLSAPDSERSQNLAPTASGTDRGGALSPW